MLFGNCHTIFLSTRTTSRITYASTYSESTDRRSPKKKNNLKKDKLILVVSKIVLYLYSIMRRYKDQKLFQKKNKNN
jgi:hypothetical protein